MNVMHPPNQNTNKIQPESNTDAEYTIDNIYPANRQFYLCVKRLFDVLFSVFLMLLLCLPMLLIALIVKLQFNGPAFFLQERLGKNGKPFKMVKFRTMHIDAEKDGPQWAAVNDPRCTGFGRILRRTRLDELPQLWNILIGDMSFVGPRPERAYFYEKFEQSIHGFRNRLRVTPGLTGLAQVNGGYDLSPKEKVILDMEYIRTQSIRTDIICIVKTLRLVFTQEGAR